MGEIKLSDIKGNSYTDRNKAAAQNKNNTRPKMDPVINKQKLANGGKKSMLGRLKSSFIKDDIDDIKTWIIEDVIGPGIKHLILDSLSMAFFHETFYNGNYRRNDKSSRFSYNSVSSSSSRNRNNGNRYDNDNRRIDYRNIIVTHRSDAEEIIYKLYDQIREYGNASIGDLYSLIDEDVKHTDFNWGWTDERDINLRQVSSGFLIDVREARYLE